jgi:REP element-mobilizing transposase RayT
MPQSLSAVYIHLVFSTKGRRPFLRDIEIRTALHSYLGGISKQLGCAPIVTGGIEDHVHLLARMSRTVTQAEWSRSSSASQTCGSRNNIRFAILIGREGTRTFQSVRRTLIRSRSTSNISRSIITDLGFRMNCAAFCGNIMSNGTRNMFGTDPTASR